MPVCICINKPIRYHGPLRPLKVRSSARKAAATGVNSTELSERQKPAFEEVRGVHVYSYPNRIVVSNGIYTTYRYRDRLVAAGGSWDGAAWSLPAGTDVRAVLAPLP